MGHGEHQQHQHDILAGAQQLGIGKACLIVEDESADPAQGADIGQHGAGNVGAPHQKVLEPPPQGHPHSPREEYEQGAIKGNQGQIPGQGQHPEGQQGQGGIHQAHIDLDEPVDILFRNQLPFLQ